MEECCSICAEPLEWVAFGPCGHKEACSKCVIRMRFVLKDGNCAICRSETDAVIVTRYMGSFTASVPAGVFAALSHKNAREKGYCCLRSINAYFDDEEHFNNMRRMCSFSHPAASPTHGPKQTFPSLRELKKHLLSTENLQFCDLCVQHRKVFLSEQELYTKSDLSRHLARGDVSGPMAESGFKGHPQCKFCRRRFFDENDIYKHMQSAHENCFICRRADPDKYVYYRDYAELEGHFRSSHFLCDDSCCLANKFVVFPTDKELRQHKALEHKAGMAKGDRREALALPTAFQYAGAGGSAGAGSSAQTSGNAAAGGARRDGSNDEVFAHTSQSGVQFTLEDFPVASGGIGAASVGGTGGSSRWASAASSSQGNRLLTQEDFPALPGNQSKAQRRRAKQRATAASVRQAPQPVAATQMTHSVSAPSLQQHVHSATQPNANAAHSSGDAPGATAPPAATGSWPSLGPEDALPRTSANLGYSSVAGSGPAGSSSSSWGRKPDAGIGTTSAFDPGSVDAFPSLPAAGPSHSKSQAKWHTARPARVKPQGPRSSQMAAEIADSATPQSMVSHSLREANKLLVEKIQQRVDADSFATFKRESGKFMRHEVDASAYFQQIVNMGLVSLTAELAALCPEPKRRAELLDVYRTQSAIATPSQDSWTPPEVVAAAAENAQAHASWRCSVCTLINAPSSEACESCGAACSSQPPDVLNSIEGELSVSVNTKKKKGKGKAINRAAAEQSTGSAGSTLPRGAWGGGHEAQLGSKIAAVQNAWARQ